MPVPASSCSILSMQAVRSSACQPQSTVDRFLNPLSRSIVCSQNPRPAVGKFLQANLAVERSNPC
jgi:hypothetical protein|eukprot:COSAG01_NODE_7488_length_3189_cov_1.847573_6_plen_65_part_00